MPDMLGEVTARWRPGLPPNSDRCVVHPGLALLGLEPFVGKALNDAEVRQFL